MNQQKFSLTLYTPRDGPVDTAQVFDSCKLKWRASVRDRPGRAHRVISCGDVTGMSRDISPLSCAQTLWKCLRCAEKMHLKNCVYTRLNFETDFSCLVEIRII